MSWCILRCMFPRLIAWLRVYQRQRPSKPASSPIRVPPRTRVELRRPLRSKLSSFLISCPLMTLKSRIRCGLIRPTDIFTARSLSVGIYWRFDLSNSAYPRLMSRFRVGGNPFKGLDLAASSMTVGQLLKNELKSRSNRTGNGNACGASACSNFPRGGQMMKLRLFAILSFSLACASVVAGQTNGCVCTGGHSNRGCSDGIAIHHRL